MRDRIADIIDEHDGEMTCYVLADLIMDALPDLVAPLVWAVSETSYADDYHTIPTKYTIRWQDEDEYRVGWNGGFSFHNSAEAAKAAANAHHVAQIMAAFKGDKA